MAIRIVADSTCDLPLDVLSAWDVTIVPLTIFAGGKVYRDKVDFTHDEFFKMLKASKELPKTSQAPPDDFAAAVQPFVDAGDEVVLITLTGDNSGTYQSACFGTQDIIGVTVVDSHQISLGLAVIVDIAVKLRDAGKTRAEIEQGIIALRDKVRLFALIDDFKYLKMGGRVSKTVALFGAMLNIKPILGIHKSYISIAAKARGHKAGMKMMLAMPEKYPINLAYPIYVGHTAAPHLAQELRASYEKRFPDLTVRDVEIGSVISTHAGPNCAGIAYVEK